MIATVRRLLALAGLPGARLVATIALGALAVGFGVALMTAAGYLISRAAEQPPILSLTTVIVVVRFLALARPLARYLERLRVGRTVLLMAHRPELAALADRVVVVDAGRVFEPAEEAA